MMSSVKCDNTSTGILVRNAGAILLIERKQYNFGFALPAGHGDGDPPLVCAGKELGEEVGLVLEEGRVILEMRLSNPCSRPEGTHHNWSIVEAVTWSGNVNIMQPDDEAKSYLWADTAKLVQTARRLKDFAASVKIELIPANLPQLVKATNENPAWKDLPGLEPPMYFLFKELKLI